MKLTFKWNKRKKIFLVCGRNRPDSRLLLSMISKDLLKELESRGYDLRTLKFEIDEQKEGYSSVEDGCL